MVHKIFLISTLFLINTGSLYSQYVSGTIKVAYQQTGNEAINYTVEVSFSSALHGNCLDCVEGNITYTSSFIDVNEYTQERFLAEECSGSGSFDNGGIHLLIAPHNLIGALFPEFGPDEFLIKFHVYTSPPFTGNPHQFVLSCISPSYSGSYTKTESIPGFMFAAKLPERGNLSEGRKTIDFQSGVLEIAWNVTNISAIGGYPYK